ncbi:hypothetical protein Tco_1313237 [Tanacetum coccineum]
MGRVYSRDPDIFLTQSKSQSQSEEPKEESNSSPHSLWTVFQGNLKFVPKENTKKTPQESASVQPATKHATTKKPTTTTPVKHSKPAPPLTKKPSKRKLPQKVRKGKPTFQLVDEDDEAQQESIPQEEGDDPDLELAKKIFGSILKKGEGEGRAPVGGVTIRDPVSEATSKLHEVVGKGKAVDSTTGPSSQPEDDTSKKVIHESSSTSDSERTESETETAAPKDDKDQGEVDSSTVTSGVSIPVSDPEKAHEALAGPDPEPMKEDQTGSDSGKLHVSLAGPNPEHMDDEFLATAYPKVHENLKLITDERVIDDKPESHSGSMSSMKNLDDTFNFGDQFLYDKPTEDDQEKSKVREESDSTIPDPSHQTVTSTPPVIAPFTDVSSSKPSLLVTPPPINTEATTITTSLPEITPFIALQLRVARLEQEMSEVKKTDHSADVLASIKSQVPTAVDKYLGTKLDDALLKVLERHTADLIEKYSVLPGPESIQNQESEKSPKEIIRAKKEQGEEKQDSTYSIRSTDKVDLEEFDLKSALFKHMNKIKSANRNTANYHLYHALMEALIADEDAMDKEVADKVKDHKRKHDSDDDEDDDDDEGPSAGSNQGRSTKRRRSDSAASGSAQPPPKDKDQSSKKPRESDASASKQHPVLTSTGWQITDPTDEGNVSDMEDSVIFQPNFFFNKDLDYLLTGGKERRIALSISKLKAARYLDFGLEELVPSLWVESEREYDISAVYGITHWLVRLGTIKDPAINRLKGFSRDNPLVSVEVLSVILPETSELIPISFFTSMDRYLLRATSKQALGRIADHLKMLDGDGLPVPMALLYKIDVSYVLARDLMKAQDHCQRQALKWILKRLLSQCSRYQMFYEAKD